MLQRPHFFPKVKPSSVAQTAHCVRIILCMVKIARGQPYDANALEQQPLLVSYRTLAHAACRVHFVSRIRVLSWWATSFSIRLHSAERI